MFAIRKELWKQAHHSFRPGFPKVTKIKGAIGSKMAIGDQKVII